MQSKFYVLFLLALLAPVFACGQLISFNAGPKNSKYNICEDEIITLYTYDIYFDEGPNPVSIDWTNSPVPENERFIQQPTFSPTKAGIYNFKVTMTDLTYNVTLEKSFQIVVVGKPLAKAGSDVSLCIGNWQKLNAVETLNSASVLWTHNGRGQLLDVSIS